jgi:cytochrome c peroxidase
MTIAQGDRLPSASFLEIGPDGPAEVALDDLVRGRRVAIFALPGAFTRTCSEQHVPSFVRTAAQFSSSGIDEILCISVNDPHVMRAWSEATGAGAAGIRMLADASGAYTRAVGMAFDAPAAGFHGRSRRYSMLVEDGIVSKLNVEEARGVCELSSGETLLASL